MPRLKKSSDEQYSGFVLTFEPARTTWLAYRLAPDAEFSESFSAIDSTFDDKELVLLSLHKEPLSISAVALMERMHGSGGSGKLKMKMTKTVVFDPPVSEGEIASLPIHDLMCTPETLKRPESSRWNLLLSSILRVRPKEAQSVVALMSERTVRHVLVGQSGRIDTLNQQRDGIGLSLDIAQMERAKILKGMKVDAVESANSVLDLMDTIPIAERSLLEHDRRLLELLLAGQSVVSAGFRDQRQHAVRVHVVDQTNLETVLGIDLIIYIVSRNNFLLLQYKKMEKSNSGWHYSIHPSSNLHQQLDSMSRFRTAAGLTNPVTPTLWSFRLNHNPFFFKFCESFKPEAREESLLPGITMSELHLREFLELPEATSENGKGRSIGYQNCPHYLNNSQFIDLARNAWIGAGPQATQLLQQVLQANRDGGRSAMLAVIDVPELTAALGRRRTR